MGLIITKLTTQRRTLPQTQFLQNNSLSKIQQNYSAYKQKCEAFSIDSTEFIQIFGTYHPIFDLLDTSHTLLIDQLELFSGMVLFSKLVSLQDKIQFVVKLFDFNELKSLSITDLEFMMITCVSVTGKLLGIKSGLCQQTLLSFVHEQFQDSINGRVNISQIKNWALSSIYVAEFLQIIYNQGSLLPLKYQESHTKNQTLLSNKLYHNYLISIRNQLPCLLSSASKFSSLLSSFKKCQKTCLSTFQKLIQNQSNNKSAFNQQQNNIYNPTNKKPYKKQDISIIDTTLKPAWVYGIRHRDVKYYIQFVNKNEVIYYTGKIAIIYNIDSDKQRYYLQHTQPIICLAVNKNSQIIATSQIIQSHLHIEKLPEIKIWDQKTLKTIKIIVGQHKIGIHLLKFSESGQYLITASLVYQSTIVIYNCQDNYNGLFYVSCSHPTVEISNIYQIAQNQTKFNIKSKGDIKYHKKYKYDENQKHKNTNQLSHPLQTQTHEFIIATLYGLRYFQIKKPHNHYQNLKLQNYIKCQDLNNSTQQITEQNDIYNNTYKYGNYSPITCCAFLNVNQTLKYLTAYDQQQQKLVITGHEKGQIIIWSINQNKILFQLSKQCTQITSIIPSYHHILISSNFSIINLWDIDLRKKRKLCQIDITNFQLNLKGYEIATVVKNKEGVEDLGKYISQMGKGQYQYLVGTTKGQFFIFKLVKKCQSSLKYKIIGPTYQSISLPTIFALPSQTTTHKYLQNSQKNLLLLTNSMGILWIIDSQTHILISQWKIGQPIVAIDCIEYKQNITIIAATTTNKIYYNYNMIQRNQKYETQKNINCIKMIIQNGHQILIIGLDDGQICFINIEDELNNKKNIVSRSSAASHHKIGNKYQQIDQYNKICNTAQGYKNYQQLSSSQKQTNNVKRIKVGSPPTQIILLQKKMLLVTTEDNLFFLVSLKDYHYKEIQIDKNPLAHTLIKNKCIKAYYCYTQSIKKYNKINSHSSSSNNGYNNIYKLPLAIQKTDKTIIASQLNGSICVWKNLTQCLQQNKLVYNWHSSPCSNLTVNSSFTKLYSSGYRDGTLIQSNILKFFEHKRSLHQPTHALVSISSIVSLSDYNTQSITQYDKLIEKQLQFCKFKNQLTLEHYEQHIQIRGLQNQTLVRLFSGMSSQWKQINKNYKTQKTTPALSLKLDYVYGIETDNKRQTVLVIHKPSVSFIYFVSNVVIVYNPFINGQKIYRGHRYKVTCIDKICVENRNRKGYTELIASGQSTFKPTIKIWDHQSLQTLHTIYTVHKWGIINIKCTATTILSYGFYSSKSEQMFSLELSCLQTQPTHYQSHQKRTIKSIAHRQLKQLIYSMSINPLKLNQFITTGKYNVTVWQAIAKNIQKMMIIEINNIVTCCAYRIIQQMNSMENQFDYKEQNQMQTQCRRQMTNKSNYIQQILVGCQNGQIGIIFDSKYIPIGQLHTKSINCIKYVAKNSIYQDKTQQTKDKTKQAPYLQSIKNKNIKYIVTSSQDQTIKIWNKNFQPLFQQLLRKIQFQDKIININNTNNNSNGNKNLNMNYQANGLNNQNSKKNNIFYNSNYNYNYGKQKNQPKNISIQSIHPIYNQNLANNSLCLLLATRNGDIILMKQFADQNTSNNSNNNNNYNKYSDNVYNGSSKRILKRPSLNKRILNTEIKQSLSKKATSKQTINPSINRDSLIKNSTKNEHQQHRQNKNQLHNCNDRRQKQRITIVRKSISRLNYEKQKLQLRLPSYSKLKINFENTTSYQQQQENLQNLENYKIIQNAKFILYLRNHCAQISVDNRTQDSNSLQNPNKYCLQFQKRKRELNDKLLFTHHPKLQIVVTLSYDNNLMFWDTQRNKLILNRMLGDFAEPTTLKFSKDGDILILGYYDGRLIFLQSQISKSHQGKYDDKFILPTLKVLMEDKNIFPVLAIEQSESGDYLAVSYNNKLLDHSGNQNANTYHSHNISQLNTSQKNFFTQSSHIRIFLNKSREKTRSHNSNKMQHNSLFEIITTIPCQANSIYVTENNNKYGMAVHSMMFTQSQGKTYLLIYQQLIDVITNNILNFNKDGNYVIWDVNTATMIANLSEVSNLIWKKLAVPNSIYARYQRYNNLTLPQNILQVCPSTNPNLSIPYISEMLNLDQNLVLGSINGDLHIAQTSCLEYQKMLIQVPKQKQLFVGKTFSAHCSQINQISVNAQRTYLYTTGLKDRCVYKWKIEGNQNYINYYTQNSHQSIKNNISFRNNQQVNTNINTSGVKYNTQLIKIKKSKKYTTNQNNKIQQNQQVSKQGYQQNSKQFNKQLYYQQQQNQQLDIFKEIPTNDYLKQLKYIYLCKQQNSCQVLTDFYFGNYYNVRRILNYNKMQDKQKFALGTILTQQRKIKNIPNFIETINVINIVGRHAHNIRNNLWYDRQKQIIYNTGHSIVILKENLLQSQIQHINEQIKIKQNGRQQKIYEIDLWKNYSSPHSTNSRQFMHMMNGSGYEPCQQINCTFISHDRKLLYTCHNGLNASITVWLIQPKLRITTIILKKLTSILKIRTSTDNTTTIIYGIDPFKIGYLMFISLVSYEVIAVVNFKHEKVWNIKDIAYYPNSNSKFVTCGINQTLAWKLQANQLTYSVLKCFNNKNQQILTNPISIGSYPHTTFTILHENSYKNNNNNSYITSKTQQKRKQINLCITFLPKSHRIITGCQDGNIIFWGENAYQRKEHDDMIMILRICQPNILMSGSRDGVILLWMQDPNSIGLTLHSKLNIKADLCSISNPNGKHVPQYPKNAYYSNQSAANKLKQENAEKSQRKQSQQQKYKHNISTEQILKNKNSTNLQYISNKQFCIQSIDIMSQQMNTSNNDNHYSIGSQKQQYFSNNKSKFTSDYLQKQAQKIQQQPKQNEGKNEEVEKEKKVYYQQNYLIKKWSVLIGTSSGNIYETTIYQQKKTKINFANDNRLVQLNHDYQIPQSFFFSKNDTLIYTITSKGYLLCRWISNLQVIFQYDFNRETIDLLYVPKYDKFIIIFKTQIGIYETFENATNKQIYKKQYKLKQLANLQIKYITHAQISPHEKVLAIGYMKNSDKSINIQLYDVSKRQQIKFLLNFIMPIGQTVKYIDFSLNNKILLIKLMSGKMIAKQLISLQNIRQETILYIEWSNKAKNLYDRNRTKIQKIYQLLNNTNLYANTSNSNTISNNCNSNSKQMQQQNQVKKYEIITIDEIVDNIFIMIDNQGNIYAFNNQLQLIGQSRLKISLPSIVKFSQSKKLIGIGSEIDKNIVIFDIGLTQIFKGFKEFKYYQE